MLCCIQLSKPVMCCMLFLKTKPIVTLAWYNNEKNLHLQTEGHSMFHWNQIYKTHLRCLVRRTYPRWYEVCDDHDRLSHDHHSYTRLSGSSTHRMGFSKYEKRMYKSIIGIQSLRRAKCHQMYNQCSFKWGSDSTYHLLHLLAW